MPFSGCYREKRVLITGHTGFKGAWLCEWLLGLGAEVAGFSLAPPTVPSLFEQLGLARRMRHLSGDVRDLAAVKRAIAEVRPAFVFHLAAQSLVRCSYDEPVETFATNIMGTVNVLEAVRHLGNPCSVVVITTDKCYENKEWLHSYREGDPLGGHDPYSSSKGAAELVVASYRRSFFQNAENPIAVASARAGNVIGGGDWAKDRILPDCIRALQRGEPISVRNKVSTRPWQHVLEPLSGYLVLGHALAAESVEFPYSRDENATAFNFGPPISANRTVAELVQEVLKNWAGTWVDRSDPHAVHEAKLLNLATDKAHHMLHWRPVWSFAEAVGKSVAWYRDCARVDLTELTRQQIAEYVSAARDRCVKWAQVETGPGASTPALS